jgi:hypothetical protein
VFARLDEAGRRALLERAELELQAIDTGLIASRGAWIQVGSEARSSGWYSSSNPLQFGLTAHPGIDRRRRLPIDPRLARSFPIRRSARLAALDRDRILQLSTDTISLAHVGTPEDRDESLAGL